MPPLKLTPLNRSPSPAKHATIEDAAKTGNATLLAQLMRKGKGHNCDILQLAALNGHNEVIRTYLAVAKELNMHVHADDCGYFNLRHLPLHLAITAGHPDTVKLLIELGANPLRQQFGKNAREHAIYVCNNTSFVCKIPQFQLSDTERQELEKKIDLYEQMIDYLEPLTQTPPPHRRFAPPPRFTAPALIASPATAPPEAPAVLPPISEGSTIDPTNNTLAKNKQRNFSPRHNSPSALRASTTTSRGEIAEGKMPARLPGRSNFKDLYHAPLQLMPLETPKNPKKTRVTAKEIIAAAKEIAYAATPPSGRRPRPPQWRI